jgi:hypothetical protein
MSDSQGKSATLLAVFVAIGGWVTAAITNWEKTPWGRATLPPSQSASEPTKTQVRPEPVSFFVQGRTDDTQGRPIPGVRVKVTELKNDGSKRDLPTHETGDSGSFEFSVTLSPEARIRIQTEQRGYRSQTIILQRDALTIPATLAKDPSTP